MNTAKHHQIWQRNDDQDGVVWLALDVPDSSTNTLTAAVLEALEQRIAELESIPAKGLVLFSTKDNGFIAGADINIFRETHSEDELFNLIRQVQLLFNRLEALPFPTLALIHGFCLGGGLELALACDYRIAVDDDKTKIGLPEVRLGIHPGYGGSVRLIEKLGVMSAMPLMLSGRLLSARSAVKAGVIDEVVSIRQLRRAAKDRLLKAPPAKRPPRWQSLLNTVLLRPAVAFMLRRETAKRAKIEHYPAPFALIDVWHKQPSSRDDYFAAEARSVAKLLVSDSAQNLVRLFFLRQRLKGLGKLKTTAATHVHVIGAGVMGGDIAAWCALQGLRVTLQDQSPHQIAPAIKRAQGLFKKTLKLPFKVQAAMDRLIPDPEGLGVKQADVVIEAIFENLEAKQALYQKLEPQLRPDTLLATNTSSIKLETLATCLEQPERLVGLHFFNPVSKMQLVEVVNGDSTAEQWRERAMAFVVQIDRLPLPVKSAPGFLINRILMPYLLEAVTLAQEGVALERIDNAAKDYGMPMGPIELADTVGLDICQSVAEILAGELGLEVPPMLEKLLDQGRLGKKSGHGFYRYDKNGKALSHRTETGPTISATQIQQRLILRLFNECSACLADGIVADSELLDAGMVFGTGFAPFRGGPVHAMETKGITDCTDQLKQFSHQYGERFLPHPGWRVLS